MHYLIIPSNSIGGSEVRLVNNWTFTQQNVSYKPVTLVLTQHLFDALKSRDDVWQDVKLYIDKIVIASFSNNFYDVQKKLKYMVDKELREPETVVILLQVPLKAKRNGVHFVHIYPGTSMIDATVKAIAGQIFSFLKAHSIDVLDPKVYKLLRTVFFFKRRAFRLTAFGINQHSLKLVSQIKYELKVPEMTFVGRFIRLKQILEFTDVVLHIHKTLKKEGIENFKFNVVGNGPLEHEVRKRVDLLKSEGVVIEQLNTANPYNILLRSKVYFSLQKHNNYPSQSLIEAMLCGCLPIVTDCGNSRDFFSHDNAFFVREKFSAEGLAKHCKYILSLSNEEFELQSQQMIGYLTNKFPTHQMADYYNSLLV